MSEGQSGGLLPQGCDFPSMLHTLGWATNHCLKWYAVLAPTQGDFFYVPLTVQVLLVQSGILFHCGFHEYRGNSWQVPGTRKSKASQWWKMGLRSCLSRVNCRSESQTYHLSYLPLGEKKIVLSTVCHCWYLPGLLFRAVYISRSFVIVLWKYGVVSWLARKSAMLL